MTMNSRLPRSTPEAQCVAPDAIEDFVKTANQHIQHLHSFMLLRHGQVIAEGWWYPWKPDMPHVLYSLSKSFTSTAVGLAVDEGRLSVDDPVLKFFPDETPRKVSPNLAAMKVHHLLSMSTGHDQDTTERVMPDRSPFKKFLSLEVEHVPGTYFVYNTAATFMLSGIVQRLTRQTLLEYLTPRLFDPLEIKGAAWESHPNGVNFGGYGLNITTEDIARFGQLYLQEGSWNGRQIVPLEWVKAATCVQVSNANQASIDWCQGYGYQFWRCRHNSYRGDGAFGQFCIVMPEQDAVLAMTGGVQDMQSVLDVVWEKLLPAFMDTPQPAAQPGLMELKRTLECLAIDPPGGSNPSPMAGKVSGKCYNFEPNYETLKSLRFDFAEHKGKLTYQLLGGGSRRGKHTLEFGYGSWMEGQAVLGATVPQCVAASGAWTAVDTFTLTICQVETPYILTLACRFEGNQLFYDARTNVAFGPAEKPRLVGSSG